MSRLLICLVCLLGVFYSAPVAGQKKAMKDTVIIDIQTAQQRFLNKNLALIAQKFNIDIAKAQIIQARAYYNPNVSGDVNIYNPNTQKAFDFGYDGNVDFTFTQLVSIAGKHINTVKLAKNSAAQAELAFADFLRGLYYQMYSDYNTIYYSQEELKALVSQEKALDELISGSQEMLKLGYIPANDLFRLKAELNDLENQSIGVISSLLDVETDLKVMLGYPDSIYLVLNERKLSVTTPPAYTDAITQAESSRPDVLLAHKNVDYNKINLNLQKSTAYPDLGFYYTYSRQGSYIRDYRGLGVGLDVPIFNHNQGNIKAARFGLSQAVVNDTLEVNTLRNEIATSYVTFLLTKSRVEKFNDDYSKELEQLKDYAFLNYKKRVISLLDFLDQLRTYNTAKLSLINLNSSYIDAANDFNFKTGKEYFK